jgi:hypothetical protein
LNAAFAMAILYLISCVHPASFVIMQPKYLKYSEFSCYFWAIIIWTKDGCLQIIITLVFSTFISIL